MVNLSRGRSSGTAIRFEQSAQNCVLVIRRALFANYTHISDRSDCALRLRRVDPLRNTYRRSPAPASTDRREYYRSRSISGSALDGDSSSLRTSRRDHGASFCITRYRSWNFHDHCRDRTQIEARYSFTHLYGDRSRCGSYNCDEDISFGSCESLAG